MAAVGEARLGQAAGDAVGRPKLAIVSRMRRRTWPRAHRGEGGRGQPGFYCSPGSFSNQRTHAEGERAPAEYRFLAVMG
jgi:hypothetical protein